VLSLSQAGGGGYGDPAARPAADVLTDVREGYVSPDAAREHDKVVVRETGTARLRSPRLHWNQTMARAEDDGR
jgi:N-methylhydantoinase B/oxoprolinase/acetone carboxylase alpha subunit